MKKDWQLTESALGGLLDHLDAGDRERAGYEYERLRQRLIRLFEWRGVDAPEDFADETMNRTARKIEEGVEIESVSSFIGGVARNLLHEFYSESERQRKPQVLTEEMQVSAPVDEDARVPCFKECIDVLPSAQGQLLVDYYNRTDVPRIRQRKDLAAQLGETPNALRIRVHRTRSDLERCMDACLEREVGPAMK